MSTVSRAIGMVVVLGVCTASSAQPPPGMIRMLPVMQALDADGDAVVSAAEIANAPSALASLDADENGRLDADELVPRFGPPRGGPGGPGGPPGGPRGMLRRLPVMTALDADGSGDVSPEEIRNAARALASLDRDDSGTLSTDELTPRFGFRGRFANVLQRSPLMAALDVDTSGGLSPDEIGQAAASLRSLDSNGDGELTETEIMPDPPDFAGGGGGPGAPRGRGGGGGFGLDPRQMFRILPVMRELDVDSSGHLDDDEIAAASESLAYLDADASGDVSADELSPFAGGGGFPGGGFFGDTDAARQEPDEVDPEDGVATIPTRVRFGELAYQGTGTLIDTHLIGLEFVKFVVARTDTDEPTIYFMNTKTHRAHMSFMRAVGLPFGGFGGRGGMMLGVLVYRPLLTSPSGKQGLYTFEFEPSDSYPFEKIQIAHHLLAQHSPILAGNLAYHPLPVAIPRYENEQALYAEASLPVFLDEDLLSDVAFLPLNRAEGYGRLRVMELDERPGPRDVVLYRSLPNEMPRVAGVITEFRQTPLSHVNLRAVQDGIPNAYIAEAAGHAEIARLVGRYVRYEVRADGYEIREATLDEVDTHFADLRPDEPQSPARDLSVTPIRSLDELQFDDASAVGVKAANVAALRRLDLPDGVVPDGFAIPFSFYDAFMQHNGLYTDAKAMIDSPAFASETTARRQQLREFRRAVRNGGMPDWMMSAMDEMHRAFPEARSVRLRSSTNNEDLPGFSGAGLYDSYTHHPDEGHISKSVKQVFASLWNFRAYEEREFFRVDHFAAAMGVLVHPNYSGELANGVAVSDDIVYQTGGPGRARSFYVNAQVGEDLVTNPEVESIAEELLLSPRSPEGDRFVRASNRVADGQTVLSDDHRDELRRYLNTIHKRFRALYGLTLRDQFAIEIEFKVTAEGRLAIKQARPWVYDSGATTS